MSDFSIRQLWPKSGLNGQPRLLIKCPLFPHPGPLPQGEGTRDPAHRTNGRTRLLQARRSVLPLPWGEGREEVKGAFVQSAAALLAKRFLATQTPWGRFRLKFHFLLRRFRWRWLVRGASLIKRAFDIFGSLLLLTLLSPLMLLIALLVKLEDGGSVIFAQIRVGKFGREFKFYKFRSMCLNAEARLKELLSRNHHAEGVTFKVKDDPRITRVGKWLRKYSLDELPQLYNVLIGDMSLVGPRPPVPREVALYSLEDRRRLCTIPGLTCFWQIEGRCEIDFSGQVRLDVEYIERQSFWLDLQILLKTPAAVLSARGAC
ncbi:MAG: sugar transferase [Verrucomicrobia bacterium]|nr:sugar transferase [Verrucomicrobiota bacterium]